MKNNKYIQSTKTDQGQATSLTPKALPLPEDNTNKKTQTQSEVVKARDKKSKHISY